jgi:hypothetical protein
VRANWGIGGGASQAAAIAWGFLGRQVGQPQHRGPRAAAAAIQPRGGLGQGRAVADLGGEHGDGRRGRPAAAAAGERETAAAAAVEDVAQG